MRLFQCVPGLHGFLGKAQIGRVTLKQSESYLHISVEACIMACLHTFTFGKMIRICDSVQIIVLCVFVHPSDAFKKNIYFCFGVLLASLCQMKIQVDIVVLISLQADKGFLR